MKTSHSFYLRGFTLVELIVTIAILAVVMAVAVPSFTNFKRNSELTAAANSFVGMLAAARGEAMKSSTTAVVLPLDGANWANGWIAFLDKNFDGVYNADTDTLIMKKDESLPSYFSMTKLGTAESFKYNGSGYSVTGAGFGASTLTIARTDITGSELLSQTRRVKVSSTGRVRVCTPKTSTDTLCSGTAVE